MVQEPFLRSHSLRDRVADFATIIVALCALGLAGEAAIDHLKGPSVPGRSPREDKVLQDWRELTREGNRVGADSGRVEIIVFEDYECPFSRRLQPPLRAVMEAYPEDVTIVHRHLPLSIHEHAYGAARVAQCAADEGRFQAVHEALYAAEDLSNLDLPSLATDAGVGNVTRFFRCARLASPVPEIEADIKVAAQNDINAVPSVIVGGVLLAVPPDSLELFRLVRNLLIQGGEHGRDQPTDSAGT